jgi:hypothetical protein
VGLVGRGAEAKGQEMEKVQMAKQRGWASCKLGFMRKTGKKKAGGESGEVVQLVTPVIGKRKEKGEKKWGIWGVTVALSRTDR